jgi:L-aminopeptidase/D-esterase-like protein
MPRALLACALLLAAANTAALAADQAALEPVLNDGDQTLRFDWPAIHIGTGEYEEGPTGVTVFHFPKRALAAVDVRGGGPGTVNTDFLRLGYDTPELDTVVFAGGSWYGLENTTATATALKDDGTRDGDWTNLALSVGAIIYDLGDRRLNELYPDKRLGQAALRAARPGVFPLGAHGAGRFARTGGLFGCNAYSGQGGAFRQIGELKIAAFVVVNALGVITTRAGRVAACYPDAKWPQELRTTDLLASYPASGKPGSTLTQPAPSSTTGKPVASLDPPATANHRNTTISLVVTNQKLSVAELQRLATHVHSSMSRAIQPFATEFDGDVLYAVTTAELQPTAQKPGAPAITIDVLAAETMWDAILASIPPQPVAPQPAKRALTKAEDLAQRAGDYVFSPFVSVRVTTEGNKLLAQATGKRPAYAIRRENAVELQPVSANEYTVAGRYPLTISFATPGQLVLNPGHWQQIGMRQSSN